MRQSSRALAALLVTSALSTPAFADLPAPRFVNVDANGVDLTSGKVQFALVEGGIGKGEGAVRMQRIYAEDAGWVDNYSGGMFDATVNNVTKTYVQLAGINDVFTNSGGTYTSDNAAGSTLVYDSVASVYRYTAADGTQIVFNSANYYPDYSYSCRGANPQACHVPLSITKPNGLKISLTWDTGILCNNTIPTEPCYTEKDYRRLTGISTSAGYSATISYASNDIGLWPNPNTNWFNRSSISFTNSANAPSPVPTISYGYPSSGVTTVTDPAGRQWTLTVDTSGRIIGVRRPGSTTDNITYAYGADGTVSSATKDGVTTTYSRVVSGSTATETTTNPSGQTVTTSNLNSSRPISFKNELGNVTSYQYDANARLTRTTLAEGNSVQYAYDARGNVTTTTNVAKSGSGLANIVTSASFDATCANVVKCNKPNSTTDANNNTTTYAYDPTHGGVVTVTQPAPAPGAVQPQTRYSYNQITSASTDKVYELTGTSVCQTTASCTGTSDESKTSVAYNSNLLPTSLSRGDGTGALTATASATYDSHGNVSTVTGPLGTAQTTKYRWDSADQLVGVTDPGPGGSAPMGAVRLTYRSDGQVSKREIGTVTDQSDAAWSNFAVSRTVDIGYDSNGRNNTVLVSSGGTTYSYLHRSYDALGRIDCTAVRMNSAVYNSLPGACSLSTQGTYGPDLITKNIYDAASQLTQVQVGVGPGAAANERTLTYNPNGTLATLTDANNNVTSYTYDGFDRLSRTTYPGGSTDQLTLYDANGNVNTRVNRAGQSFSFTYDALNRLTSKSGAVPQVNYSYDNLGRTLSATFASGGVGITNGYDALSRVTSTSSNMTGATQTLSYQYDLAGNRIQLTYPDGHYLNYDHLVTGDVTAVRLNGASSGLGVIGSYAYDALGRRASRTNGDGSSTSYSYDPIGRLSSLQLNFAASANNLTKTFAYSPASQIVSETRSNDAYAWNAAANVNRPYAANGLNQYTTAGPAAYAYDGNGNLTSDGTNSFAYDAENHLTSATVNGVASTLSYDPLGRLWRVQSGSNDSRFVYDGGNMVADYNGPTLTADRLFGPGVDEPLSAVVTGPTPTGWWLADERGSIIARTDGAGNVNLVQTYDEYGIPGSSNKTMFQYTGQMYLPQIGMYYYKARMYSTTLGRFMQTDPAGYGDGPNWYAYTHNDPVNGADPSGQCGASSGSPINPYRVCNEPPVVITGTRVDPVVITGTSFNPVAPAALNIDHPSAIGQGLDQAIEVTGRRNPPPPTNAQPPSPNVILAPSSPATIAPVVQATSRWRVICAFLMCIFTDEEMWEPSWRRVEPPQVEQLPPKSAPPGPEPFPNLPPRPTPPRLPPPPKWPTLPPGPTGG